MIRWTITITAPAEDAAMADNIENVVDAMEILARHLGGTFDRTDSRVCGRCGAESAVERCASSCEA